MKYIEKKLLSYSQKAIQNKKLLNPSFFLGSVKPLI